MPKKYFTIEQANRLLPLIEQEINELKRIQQEFDEKWQTYHQVKEETTNQVKTDSDTLFKLEAQLEFIEMEAQLHVQNIQQTGAQLKGIEPGLVDFPSFMERSEVLLCWREGEDEIAFYHHPKEGYAGRRPLDL
ncbi:DUF2203 domain-containing protein [Alkalicoccus urumqiensis]|uniref:DUF2203 domain-containing protein n=1 Tax=Alkalicoccus urumqiensis TaxID=1548213 RepID=A0A2P6ML04_ALKUR|nr:DUF2203 domain-containing protein [Alkalicoccus urumqiensis]PRO66961.1 DUF2203 domain-containing protein [Alkalicoccus urumqiensis]